MTRHRLRNNGGVHYRPRGSQPRVILDPTSNRAMCPTCGMDYMNQRLAESCRLSHPPVFPGGTVRPRRPEYVPEGAVYAPMTEPIRRRAVWRYLVITLVGVMLALGAAAAIGVLAADMSEPGRGPGSVWITPQTYGPPGPSGGPLLTKRVGQ